MKMSCVYYWEMLVRYPYDSCEPHLEPCLRTSALMEHGDGSPRCANGL